jgi:hypothetical protein
MLPLVPLQDGSQELRLIAHSLVQFEQLWIDVREKGALRLKRKEHRAAAKKRLDESLILAWNLELSRLDEPPFSACPF